MSTGKRPPRLRLTPIRRAVLRLIAELRAERYWREHPLVRKAKQ